jgi:fibronectin-binding autotransporter adhesin
MKPKFHRIRRRAFACTILSFVFTQTSADAQWAGAGVSGGGVGNVVTDPANWTGGIINGEFSTITLTDPTTLILPSDLTLTNGTAVSTTLAASFASGATSIQVNNASGIQIGSKIGGTGIASGSYVKEINGDVITPSMPTSSVSGSGSYTFTPVALNFNFGASDTSGTSTASGVDLSFASDVPEVPKLITIAGNVLLPQRTFPASAITTDADIGYRLSAQTTWSRMSGDATSETPATTVFTINGPVDLGTFSTSSSRLVLEGGSLTINGQITGGANGSGPAINFGSVSTAGTLTLTNPTNNFISNFTNGGNGALSANSEVPVADIGQPSALGAGSVISTNNRTITLTGFSNPVSTNRKWNVGGGSGRLNNNGTAPVYLTGEISNSVATGSMNLGGSYSNRALPNRVTGNVINGSLATGLTVAAAVWEVTNDTNSFTRAPQVTGSNSTLRYTSIANSGVNSSLGSGPSITLNAPGSGSTNYFEYVGDPDASTDRTISITGNVSSSANNSVVANGEGDIEFAGTITSQSMTPNGTTTRTLILEGAGNGTHSGPADFRDRTTTSGEPPEITASARVGLLKRGSGKWTISGGSYDHTGPTRVQAGDLVLDYSVNNQLTASSSVTLNGGHLTVIGADTGSTAVALPPLAIGEGGSTADYNSFRLVVKGEGDGTALTIPSLTTAGSTIRLDLIDISGNPGNSVTVSDLTGTSPVMNGLFMTSSSGRNTIVLKDAGGYGFPVRDEATGMLSRFNNALDLPTSGFSATRHYKLSGGTTVNTSAQLLMSSLQVDTSDGDATLDVGSSNINPSGSGRGVLLTGDHDFILAGSGGSLNSSSIFIHNYLEGDGTFRVNGNLGNSSTFIVGGEGYTEYDGTGFGGTNSSTSGLSLMGGVFTAIREQDVSALVTRLRISDSVFEIGADLNGGAKEGDFSNDIGIESNGRIAFYYDSGISARGNGRRVVNFGGEGRSLLWGRAGFLTVGSSDSDGGFTLRLSSERSDATIEIVNPIDLNANALYGRRRTIDVADGSAAVDAELSGAITGESRLRKTGKGTLRLSGANTYSGGTTVLEGRLLLADGVSAGPVAVRGTGTIGGTGNAQAATIDGTLEVEISGGTSSKLNVTGDLTISAGASLAVILNGQPTETSYLIAEYTGTRSGTFTNVPADYSVDYSQPNKIVMNRSESDAYSLFIAAAYPGSEDPETLGADKDPDHDGLVNAVEFVLNSDPADGTQSNLPKVRKSDGYLVFEFTRRKDAALAGYITSVETSETLQPDSWATPSSGVVIVDHPGNPEVLEDVTVSIPEPSPGTKLFARLRVTFP